MRNDLISPMLDRPTTRSLDRRLVDTRLLGAGVTVLKESPPILNFDCGGAGRIVTMPAPDSELEGAMFIINNWSDAAEDLTINNSAAATILTISQNEAGVVMYLNGVTYGRLWGALT